MPRVARIVKAAFLNFFNDEAFTLAAALAFYTALSLAPLAVILVSITSFVGANVREGIVSEVRVLIGHVWLSVRTTRPP